MSSFKSAKYSGEPCYVCPRGEWMPYVPIDIITHRDAYSAVLHMTLKHMADFQILMTEIICEKYNLDADEMMKTIQDDIRMQDMNTHPVIDSMGYYSKEELAAKIALEELKAKEEPKVVMVEKKVVRKKKVAVGAVGAVAVEAVAVEAVEAVEAVKAVEAVAVEAVEAPKSKKLIRKKKE